MYQRVRLCANLLWSDLAQRGAVFLLDLGYFKTHALAAIAAAQAYLLTRRTPQTPLFEAVEGRVPGRERARVRHAEPRPLLEKALDLGARARGAARPLL